MTESLDSHCTLLSPEELRLLREESSGRFGGVGVLLGATPSGVGILSVRAGSVADKAGLGGGERILEVDGSSVAGLHADRLAARLRGAPGTKVRLKIAGQMGENARDLTLVREAIRLETVSGAKFVDRDRCIGYVRVESFGKDTHSELRVAVLDLHDEGLAALVLDLRGNPGGVLESAALAADLFVAKGPLFATGGRAPEARARYEATAGGTICEAPLAVLIDGGTASASEALAGALRDSGRAVLVGSPSYGKRSVQSLVLLEDGWALKLTTAVFRFPSEAKDPVPEDGEARLRPSVDAPAGKGAPGGDEALLAAVRVLCEQVK